MKFYYKARTKTGAVQSGVIEASSRESAFDILKNYGLYVTLLEEARMSFYQRIIKFSERITNKDIVLFSKQLAIMLKSGIPLIEIFHTIAKQTRNENFREKILKISEEIEGGMPLSAALSLYPKVFSQFYISVVRSGEVSGRLTEVFVYLADYLEKEHNFRSKIIGALIYPFFLIFVLLSVATLIVFFVIPKLRAFLTESGADLPLITKVVISISDFLGKWWWFLLLILVGGIYYIFYYLKTEQGKKFFDRNIFKIPLVGNFFKKVYLVRTALNLSTMISGGVPIIQALEMTAEAVNNDIYRNIILETRDEVRKGELISSVLNRYPDYITPFFYQMVVVGEKTGKLDSSLNSIVNFDQEEVYRTIDGFVKFLEPIILIFLGIIVAVLISSVLIPIYSLTSII